MMRAVLLVVCLFFSASVTAQVTDTGPLQFQSAAEEQRFHALAEELRCVKCQNQSLADSNAQIAVELRREVLVLMRRGKTDAEVKQFLVERYGEFVLYKPPFAGRNLLLWIAPIAILLAALGVLIFWQRKHRPKAVSADVKQQDVEW